MRPSLFKSALKPVVLGGALVSVLAGCVVGPNYKGPPNIAPLASQAGHFQRAAAAATSPADPPARWWLALGDAELTRLIDQALADSPSLKAAQARVRNARAVLGQQRTKLLPQGGANVAYVDAKLPSSTGSLLGGGGSSGSGSSSSSSNINLYSVGFDATWELDLFGGVRRGIENATASAEAQQATFEDAQVQLASEVAQAYVNLRDSQHRLALGQTAADLQNKMLQLTAQRRAAGTASDADMERLRTQLSQTRADLVPLQATTDQYLDQLAFLTGREPGALDAELAGSAPLPLPPESVAVGDPAAMIRRRPDIRQAERQLAAANATIGQNVANYFPSVSLFGTIGYAAGGTTSLFNNRNMDAVGAPFLTWNVLNLPKLSAQVRQAKAERDDAMFTYEKTVLAALQDAEDSLSRFGHQRQNVAQLTNARNSATLAAALTRVRYEGGSASLIDVLDTERQRVSTEQSLAQSQAMLTNDYVALQKSLGLGWQGAVQAN